MNQPLMIKFDSFFYQQTYYAIFLKISNILLIF